MTSTIIRIEIPFLFTNSKSCEFKIGNSTTINNILRLILENRKVDIANYGIFVKPHNKWLVPELSFINYQSVLADPKTILEFRSKYLRKFVITYLTTKVTTWCDPSQPLKNSIDYMVNNIQDHYLSGMTNFILQNDKSKSQDVQISAALFYDNEFSIPSFSLIRLSPISPSKTIFNGTIENALSRDPRGTQIPSFINHILDIIEKNRDIVGIYRLSGDITIINDICHHIDTSLDSYELFSFLSQQKPIELACVIKQYLRELSEPLIPTFLEKEFRQALTVHDYYERFQLLKRLIQCLPPSHYNFFARFCEHIEVIYKSTKNQMSPKNLAICMGTNILRALPGPNVFEETKNSQDLIQLIFEHWRFFFKDEGLNLRADEAITRKQLKENEKCIPINTTVKIVRSTRFHVTVTFNDIEIETNVKNVILNRPDSIKPFDFFSIIELDQFPNNREYLLPDNDPINSVINVNNVFHNKIQLATEIKSQLIDVLKKLQTDPNNQKILDQFTSLKNKFNKL